MTTAPPATKATSTATPNTSPTPGTSSPNNISGGGSPSPGLGPASYWPAGDYGPGGSAGGCDGYCYGPPAPYQPPPPPRDIYAGPHPANASAIPRSLLDGRYITEGRVTNPTKLRVGDPIVNEQYFINQLKTQHVTPNNQPAPAPQPAPGTPTPKTKPATPAPQTPGPRGAPSRRPPKNPTGPKP